MAQEQTSRKQWQLGKLFGIPLRIDSSWVLIVGLVTLSNALSWQSEFPEWGIPITWVTGFITALLLFASVLFHELGHSLVAKSRGIQVNSITLFLFGGIASLEQEAKTPGTTFWIAIAGPLVSLSLWLGLGWLADFPSAASPVHVLLQDLADINLILVLFNMIPGLPLDGGQVLKAIIWKATGNRFQGSHWAAKVGQTLGWGAVILGLFIILLTGQVTGIWMSLLGWYGLRNAYRYDRFTDLQEIVLKLNAQDVMSRSFRVTKGEQSLKEFAEKYILSSDPAEIYYAASNGRYQGLVDSNQMSTIERSQWEAMTVASIVTPMNEMPTVTEQTPLVEVVERLEEGPLTHLTVLSPAGAIAGIIERAQIVKTVMNSIDIALPEAELEKVQQNQSYPSFMPLPAIVESIKSEAESSETVSSEPQSVEAEIA